MSCLSCFCCGGGSSCLTSICTTIGKKFMKKTARTAGGMSHLLKSVRGSGQSCASFDNIPVRKDLKPKKDKDGTKKKKLKKPPKIEITAPKTDGNPNQITSTPSNGDERSPSPQRRRRVSDIVLFWKRDKSPTRDSACCTCRSPKSPRQSKSNRTKLSPSVSFQCYSCSLQELSENSTRKSPRTSRRYPGKESSPASILKSSKRPSKQQSKHSSSSSCSCNPSSTSSDDSGERQRLVTTSLTAGTRRKMYSKSSYRRKAFKRSRSASNSPQITRRMVQGGTSRQNSSVQEQLLFNYQ